MPKREAGADSAKSRWKSSPLILRMAFSVIGQCLHYRMARACAERLIGPQSFQALDLDYLTDHITSLCLAALGSAPPLDEAGETAADPAVATG